MWDLAPSHANLMSSRVGVPSNSVISSSCKANENVLHFKISPLPSFRLPFARWLHIEEDEMNRFEKEETIPSSLLLSSVDPPLSPRHFFLDQTHHGTMQRDIKTHEISRRDKIFITNIVQLFVLFLFFSEKYILRNGVKVERLTCCTGLCAWKRILRRRSSPNMHPTLQTSTAAV